MKGLLETETSCFVERNPMQTCKLASVPQADPLRILYANRDEANSSYIIPRYELTCAQDSMSKPGTQVKEHN